MKTIVVVASISVAGGARVVLPTVALSDDGVAIAVLFAGGGLAMAVVAVAVGRLSDHWVPEKIVAAGAVSSALCAGLFAVASDPAAMAVLVVVLGCCVQVGMTAGFTVLTNEHTNAGVNPALSWTCLNLVWTGGFFVGNVGPSSLASLWSLPVAWSAVSTLIVLAGASAVLTHDRSGGTGPRTRHRIRGTTMTGE